MPDAINGIVAVLGAIGVLLPIVIKFYRDLREIRREHEVVWSGITKRGFVEAEARGHLLLVNGEWQVSVKCQEIYKETLSELGYIYRSLKGNLGREPTDEEIAYAIESKYQDWFVHHACKVINMNAYGCVAVAVVLAKQIGKSKC